MLFPLGAIRKQFALSVWKNLSAVCFVHLGSLHAGCKVLFEPFQAVCFACCEQVARGLLCLLGAIWTRLRGSWSGLCWAAAVRQPRASAAGPPDTADTCRTQEHAETITTKIVWISAYKNEPVTAAADATVQFMNVLLLFSSLWHWDQA